MAWNKVSKISKIKMNNFTGTYRTSVNSFGLGVWNGYKVMAFGNSVDATKDMYEYRCQAVKLNDSEFEATSISVSCPEVNFSQKIHGASGTPYTSGCDMRDTLCVVDVRVYVDFSQVKGATRYLEYDININDAVHSRIRVYFSSGVTNAENNGCVGDNLYFGTFTVVNAGAGGQRLRCYFSSSTKMEFLGDRGSMKVSVSNTRFYGDHISEMHTFEVDGYANGFYQNISNKIHSNSTNTYLVTTEL